jgi:DUF1365 family protein
MRSTRSPNSSASSNATAGPCSPSSTADHIVKDGRDVKENVLQILREQQIDTAPIASIRLLTFPRVLGYIFNPVCFYYCL